jgi:hypothetical protein
MPKASTPATGTGVFVTTGPDPVTAFRGVVVVVPAPDGATSGERLNNIG